MSQLRSVFQIVHTCVDALTHHELDRQQDGVFTAAFNTGVTRSVESERSFDIVPSSCLQQFCCVSDLLLNTHVPLHVELLSFVLLSRAVFLLQRQLTEAMDSDLFGPVIVNAITGAVNASKNL